MLRELVDALDDPPRLVSETAGLDAWSEAYALLASIMRRAASLRVSSGTVIHPD